MYIPDAYIYLSTEESKKIRRMLSVIKYDPHGGMAYLNELKQIAYTIFPRNLLNALEKMKLLSKKVYGCVLVDNLPIDDEIIGSPNFVETGSDFKGGTLSENVLTVLGIILGEPYAISHESLELVNNLTPHKNLTQDYTGFGSSVELDFHIENAAQIYAPGGDISPFALILLGIRNGSNDPFTRIADVRKAIPFMADEDIAVLYQKQYVIRAPYRWTKAVRSSQRYSANLVPVFSGPLSNPRIAAAFYSGMMQTINKQAEIALNNLHQALKKVSFGVQITPGRLLLLNNRIMLHSRDSFLAEYDENGRAYRWLQRIFVARSLWNYRNLQNIHERVFSPELFESNIRTSSFGN